MNQPSFTEMTRRLGELSGADPRPFPEIRPITTPIASLSRETLEYCERATKLDLRRFDAEELAQITYKRVNGHDD